MNGITRFIAHWARLERMEQGLKDKFRIAVSVAPLRYSAGFLRA